MSRRASDLVTAARRGRRQIPGLEAVRTRHAARPHDPRALRRRCTALRAIARASLCSIALGSSCAGSLPGTCEELETCPKAAGLDASLDGATERSCDAAADSADAPCASDDALAPAPGDSQNGRLPDP